MSHPQPSAPSKLASFREGLVAPWEGLRYMQRNRRLWRYAVVPIALNLAITLAVLALLIVAAVAFARYLHPQFDDSAWGWIWEIAAVIGLAVAVLGAGAAAWLLLQGILCGYYNGLLAREVELQLGTRPEDLRDISLKYQVVDALRDFVALASINLVFLLMHCVPVVGSIIGVAGAVYFDCLIFGRDYFDYPLALRGLRRSEKQEFLRANRMHTLGLGAVVLLLNLVPIVGSVVLTTAVTGAVLVHRRLGQSRLASAPPRPAPP